MIIIKERLRWPLFFVSVWICISKYLYILKDSDFENSIHVGDAGDRFSR